MRPHLLKWLAVALAAWTAPALCAEEPPTITYRPTEFLGVNDVSGVILRGNFQVTGVPPHRSLGVHFTLWLDNKTMLRAGGHNLLWHWGTVVCPSNGSTWEWNDCRNGIPLKDISAAENLPKGKATEVFARCDVYDYTLKQYLGNGWDTRVALRITTDETGKVLSVTAAGKEPVPPTPPPPPPEPVTGAGYKLLLKHLKPKPGVTAVRGRPTPGHPSFRIEFFRDGKPVPLSTGLFESVDTADKARELIELCNPSDLLIRTPEQYKALADYFGGNVRFLVVLPEAPSYGISAAEEAPGKFTVRVLHYMPYPKYVSVTRSTWSVPTRGDIRESVVPLIVPSSPSLRLTDEEGTRINWEVENLLRRGGLVHLAAELIAPRR